MGQIVFQANSGGQISLVGTNTASTFALNVPAVSGNLVTTGDTGTVTNTMLNGNIYTAPGAIGSVTPNSGAFTTLTATSPLFSQVSLGTSSQSSSLGPGNATLIKNRLINGAMVIDQRNSGNSVTNINGTVYTVDRWAALGTAASKYTIQQNAASVTPPAGFVNYLGITSSSSYSVSSSDNFIVQQSIEGFNVADLNWGSSNAKAVTLSFWVYSSLTGTFSGSLTNSTGAYSYVFNYSVSAANTWTQISVNIAGPTVGTWQTTNSAGISVRFGLGCGSTFTNATTGSWISGNYVQSTGSISLVATSGATLYFTGMQLEVGSTATGFENRMYQQELALCQRYYESGSALGNGYGATGGSISSQYAFKVTKRVAPTIAFNAPAYNNCSSITAGTTYVDSASISATVGILGNASFSSGFTASSEL